MAVAAAHTGAIDGAHGILYMCGAKTGGVLTVNQSLLGRKVRRIDGAYDSFVAVVDAWALEWPPDCASDGALEHEVVSDALQHVKVQQVAAGKQHRLALTLDGEIFSWGVRNAVFEHGELGQAGNGPRLWKSSSVAQRQLCGSPEDDDSAASSSSEMMRHGNAICVPRRVHAPKELFFRTIACGRSHAAAVTDQGDLYTWGRNFEGQLGHVAKSLPPERNAQLHGICAWPKFVRAFLALPRVADVRCGAMFTLVLLENGALYSFGERFTGVTRQPAAKCDASPRLLLASGDDSAGFVGIACGAAHALAVTRSRQLYAWGWNNYGQLGLGDTTADEPNSGTTAVLTRVMQPDVAWAKVFAGGSYSAAISTDGTLFTWGIGRYGQLAHGEDHRTCERTPKRVDALQHAVVSAVVCSDRDLYAFAPTHIASISPSCGEISGGYELRIRGSGIWASDDLTVRFTPLTDGRLVRGSLGVYDAVTQEVVCRVPPFSLAGDFAVEIATNGRHFTADGHVFSAFRRPRVTSVSIDETHVTGGASASIQLDGALPHSCTQPVVRFVPCAASSSDVDGVRVARSAFERLVDVESVDALATLSSSECTESDEGNPETSPRLSTVYTVEFVTPSFAPTRAPLPCLLEISYNGGLHFVPVVVAPATSDSESDASHSTQQQHVVWFHDAHVQRVRPNSFVVRTLPQTIRVDVAQLQRDCGGVTIVARVACPHKDSDAVRASASVTLKLERSSSSECETVVCVVPPLSQWSYVEEPVASEQAAAVPATTTAASTSSWWKRMPRTGFPVELCVSMNGGKSILPCASSTVLYALPAVGSLWSVFPPLGIASGGTRVSVAGDFFHFDTPDAVVSLQWRDKVVQVPATCAMRSTDDPNANERRVVFETPALPFPGDRETAAAIAEGLVLGTHEDVHVFVALDGVHFADKSVKFVYCAVPIVIDVTPLEAAPGAKMSLHIDRLAASSHACVRLTALTSGVSAVVPAEVDEAASSVEFELPHLPVAGEDTVRVAFSVNGQQFTDADTPASVADDDAVEHSAAAVTFRYKAPPAPDSLPSGT